MELSTVNPNVLIPAHVPGLVHVTESLLGLWLESEQITCVEIVTEKAQICFSADFPSPLCLSIWKGILWSVVKNEDKCAAIIAHSSAGRIYVSNKAAIIFHHVGFKLRAYKCPKFITICVREQKGKAPNDDPWRARDVQVFVKYHSLDVMSIRDTVLQCSYVHDFFKKILCVRCTAVYCCHTRKEKWISMTLYPEKFIVITRCFWCYNKIFSHYLVMTWNVSR